MIKSILRLAVIHLFLGTIGIGSLYAQEEVALGDDRSSYDEIVKQLQDLAKMHPDTTELFDIGISDSGRPIIGAKFGNGPIPNLIVSTHHGNEYGSTAVAMGMAVSLSMKPIEGQTIYLIPVLNISGYDRRERREYAQGVSFDPNRNYPGPCGTEGPFTLKSVRALADFVDRVPFVVSATLHTYYPGALYPWGVSTNDTKTSYDSEFIRLGDLATQWSKYKVGNSTIELYPADGTFEDYAFWRHGIWSILFELGYTHSPSQKQIEQMVAINVPGLRNMFENAPMVRAPDHEFRGTCQREKLFILDRHDE